MSNAATFYGVNAPLFTSSSPIPTPQFSGLDLNQLSPGTARVLSHITVTLAILVSGRLGQKTMANFARRSMWAGNKVPLSYLGGWMAPAQMLGWIWKFREIPGGFYFAPMALTVLSGIAANLLIASFVTAIAVPTVCTGQVKASTANSSVEWADGQSPLSPSFSNALQAQVYSMANGGLPGLYWAAPIDPMFRATEKDVASSFSCAFSWTSARMTNTNKTETRDALLARVEEANSTVVCGQQPTGALNSCVAISTNFTNPDNLQVQFAIDNPAPNNSYGYNLAVHGYTCNLANLPWLQARVIGTSFTAGLSEVVESRVIEDTRAMQDVLVVMTNTMLAIDSYAPDGSAYLQDIEYGCIKAASRVQLPAYIPILACFVALVGWFISWLVALIMARRTLHTCPMDLEGWMDQAIRQKGASDIFGDKRISVERRRDWAIAIHLNPVDSTPYVTLVDGRSET